MDFREEQPAKAFFPMHATLFGMVTDNRSEQPLKASSPILVTSYSVLLWMTVDGRSKVPEYFFSLRVISAVFVVSSSLKQMSPINTLSVVVLFIISVVD